MANYSSLRDSWQPKLAPQSGARVTHFHRSLKSSLRPADHRTAGAEGGGGGEVEGGGAEGEVF